jgi:hypothetical protein
MITIGIQTEKNDMKIPQNKAKIKITLKVKKNTPKVIMNKIKDVPRQLGNVNLGVTRLLFK